MNEYTGIIREQKDSELRLALTTAMRNSPDTEAKLQRLAQRTGLPIDAVRLNAPEVEYRDRLNSFDYEKVIKENPKLSAWLSDPANASVAHDDYENLSAAEKLFTRGVDLLGAAGQGVIGQGAGSLLSGTGELYGVASRSIERALASVLPQQAMDVLRTPIPWWMNPEKILKNPGEALKDVGQQMGPPKERQNLATDVAQGVGQLSFQIASYLLTGGAISTLSMFAQGADIMADKTAKDKADPALRDTAIVAGGAITALTEKYGLDKILNRVPPQIRNRTLRFIADKAAAGGIEAAQEFTEGLLHDITRYVMTNRDAPILDGVDREMTAAALSAAIVRTALGVRGYRQAQQQEEFFKALGDNAKASKLRERMPDRFRALVEKYTENGPLQNVYVPADRFQTYFQSVGMDPVQVARDAGVTNYDEALATGGDLAIPMADFATVIAPTDHLQGLMEDLRLRQEDMTPREAREFEQRRKEWEADILEQVKRDVGQTQAPQFEQVRDWIMGELVGRFERSTAEAYATYFAKAITTMAQRAGVDPMTLMERYDPRVVTPMPEVLARMPGLDTHLDPLLDRLRAGDLPKQTDAFGKSLAEFIRDAGGLQDSGETRDIDQNMERRPGQRKMVQPDGMDLDRALQMAIEAGYFYDVADPSQLTTSDLLDALGEDLRGAPRFSPMNENAKASEELRRLQALDEYLSQLGGDVATMDNATLKALIMKGVAQDAGQQYDQPFEGQEVAQTPLGDATEVEVDGVMRPALNSEGKPIHWSVEGVRNFWRWFGDSKAVDEQGRPLVVYHGTNADFNEFDPEAQGSSGQGSGEPGFFFEASPDNAARYTRQGDGANVMPVYLALKNPLIVERTNTKYDYDGSYSRVAFANFIDDALELGHDGVIFRDVLDRGKRSTQYVAFQPEQIKSAIGNRGTFDPKKPNILFQGEQRDLMVTHNLSADNLLHADKMGGLPVPSLAITRKQNPLTGFGEITLIGPPEMADPKGYAGTKVFGADIYSPRYPNVERKLDRKALDKMMAKFRPMVEKMNARPLDMQELERNGQREMERNPAVMATFLQERGIEPTIVFRGGAIDEGRRARLEQFGLGPFLDKTDRFDLQNDPAFREAAIAEYRDALIATNGGQAADKLVAQLDKSETFQNNVVRDLAYKITEDARNRGRAELDTYKTQQALEKQIADANLANEYQQFVLAELNAITESERIFQGFTYSGSRKYIPHTLENVVKLLKKDLRGGENFNYGVGSLRAKFTPQFKSVAEIRKNKDRLISAAEFDKIKDEIDAQFWDVARAIDRDLSSETATSIIEDAVKMGVKRAAQKYGYEISDDAAVKVAEFMTRLRELPTAYFEAKILREVSLSEFKAAVVPNGVSQKVIDTLKNNGITDIRYYEKGNEADRAAQIQQFDNLFFQNGNSMDDKRGFIRFGDDRKFQIGLLERADLSTFLHETGHLWLEIMGDLAADPNSSQQVKDDYAAILNWFGVKDRSEIQVKHHEMFARANEAYLMEGKAPSAELRGVFQRFKAWLNMIYRSVARLNVELSPEVRGVFDRIYATDEEIAAAKQELDAKPMFLNAAEAGMSEAEFAAYEQSVAQATERAKEELQAKLMREFQRERERWWKERRDAKRAEVAAEIDAMQEYQALAALVAGRTPDGMFVKLDREDLVRRYGEPFLKRLPRGFQRVYTASGGLDADTAAEMLGYPSGDDLITALVNLRPRNELIEAETDRRMRDEYGDMLLDGTVADEAMAALHNTEREKVLRMELRALNKKAREVAPFVKVERDKAKADRAAARAATDLPPAAAFRQMARGIIGQKQLRDLNPFAYLLAERKASRQAFESMAKGDYVAAQDAKQRELLNHYLYLEATAVKQEADKIVDYLRGFEKDTKRAELGKAGADYLEQVDGILERYELKRVPQIRLQKREALANWLNKMAADGQAVAVPEELQDESRRVNYQQVSIDELRAVRDAVKNIAHLARLKNKLIRKGKLVDFERVVGELLDAADDSGLKTTGDLGTVSRKTDTLKERAAGLWRRFDAAHLKVEQIIEWLDGGKIDGPWARYFFDLADDAQTREFDLHRQVTQRIQDLSESMSKEWRSGLMDRTSVRLPGFTKPMTRYDLLSIAFNMGNAQNIQRLQDGYGWSDDNLQQVRDALTAEDWRFVQGVWDTLEALWPEMAALEKRMSGLEPEKVEAQGFEAAGQTWRGGYFPLVYDPRKSNAGEKQANEAESVQSFVQQGYGRPATNRGATKKRVERLAAPVLLDFEYVLTSHLAKVIKDISHREAIVGINKILTNPQVKETLIDRLGEDRYLEMRRWTEVLVRDRSDTLHQASGLGRLMMVARTNMAIVTMGWKISTMLAQFAGFGPSMDLVKPRYLAKAMIQSMQSPVQSLALVQSKSGEMRHRMATLDRDVKDALLRMRGEGGIVADVQRTAFYLTAMADRLVAVPTWLGAYNQALAQGLSEDDAIRAGDRAVRLSQGAGGAKDLAAVQRNNELMRLLTMYYTPFSVLYSRLRDVGHKTALNGIGYLPAAAARLLALVILPAVLGELLTARGPDEDEDEVWWAIRKMLLYPLATVPVLRDFSGYFEAAMIRAAGEGEMAYAPNYRFSPVVSAIDKVVRAPGKAVDAITGEKPVDDVAWDLFETSGYIFGLPTAQVRITGEYLEDLLTGDADPENAPELMRDLIFRREK